MTIMCLDLGDKTTLNYEIKKTGLNISNTALNELCNSTEKNTYQSSYNINLQEIPNEISVSATKSTTPDITEEGANELFGNSIFGIDTRKTNDNPSPVPFEELKNITEFDPITKTLSEIITEDLNSENLE